MEIHGDVKQSVVTQAFDTKGKIAFGSFCSLCPFKYSLRGESHLLVFDRLLDLSTLRSGCHGH